MPWTEAPTLAYPACGHQGYLDAHYEFQLGDEWECSKCGAAVVLKDEELIRRWIWEVIPREGTR
jgi:hypothetical protein